VRTCNLTITTGLFATYSTPTLLAMMAAGQIDTTDLVTHRFALDDIMEAYDVFSRPAQTGALKVVLTRD
jgi:alcohol dehydrogenase